MVPFITPPPPNPPLINPGWKRVPCGGKSSKMLKDGCKYCPPKGRAGGGNPVYRVNGVEGTDWFGSMEEVLRFLKSCERKVVAFPTTRGSYEPPLNWIAEAQQQQHKAAKEAAALEAAALLAAQQEQQQRMQELGAAAGPVLEAWEEEEARSGDMTVFAMAREGDIPILNVFLESDPSLVESRKETQNPDAGATPLLCAARAGQLEAVSVYYGVKGTSRGVAYQY